MNFEEIWERIKKETDLKKFSELASLVGTTNQYVSKKKKLNSFPVEWAYAVAEKYGLLTEWIMKGVGPKKINEPFKLRRLQILNEIEEWIEIEIQKNPKKKDWFEVQLEESLQGFKTWREEKKIKEDKEQSYPISKIA